VFAAVYQKKKKRIYKEILRQMLRCEEINVIKKEPKVYSQGPHEGNGSYL
jgi:hypothetical protein